MNTLFFFVLATLENYIVRVGILTLAKSILFEHPGLGTSLGTRALLLLAVRHEEDS